MESPVVDVRIRGREEMTLEAQVWRDETVEEFKRRVFGKYLGEGKQCRLIVLGKELRDAHQMGFYKIDQGSCLHVMIGPSRSAARAAIASAGNLQSDTKFIQRRASAMLSTIAVMHWIGTLVEFFVGGEPFTYAKIGSLLVVTVIALSVVFRSSVENFVNVVRSCRWPSLRRRTGT